MPTDRFTDAVLKIVVNFLWEVLDNGVKFWVGEQSTGDKAAYILHHARLGDRNHGLVYPFVDVVVIALQTQGNRFKMSKKLLLILECTQK